MAARWTGRLALIALGLGLGVVVLEIGLRLTHPAPWYERLLSEQLDPPEQAYRMNRQGLRDRDYGPKPEGVRRVLMLGDSFIYGTGVADEDAVMPRLLEKELNRSLHLDGVRGFEILNGGMPGSLTPGWVRLWNRVAGPFDPDVVLIVFFLRDGTRTTTKGAFFGNIRKRIVLRNQRSWAYAHSYLYRAFRDTADRKAVGDDYARKISDAYFGDERRTEEWKQAQENLLWLRDAARDRGATVGLVVYPILVELGDSYPFADVCAEIEHFGRSAGMPTLNLLPAFLGQYGPDLWVSAFNQHPNAKGHAIAASAVTPFVEELLRAHQQRPS